MDGWTTDPGDLVIAIAVMTTLLALGAGFVLSVLEGMFHVD